MVSELLISLAVVVLYMHVVFILALIKKDNSIVDIAWGLGFILVAITAFLLDSTFTLRKTVVNLLVVVWGSRLAIHIAVRKRGKGEDFRYAQWRKDWGPWFPVRSYFQIFWLQGVLLFFIAYPVVFINLSPEPGLSLLGYVGVGIWCIGFLFEAVGDHQMLKFKRNPANKDQLMTKGLWALTRHPNYFGESTMWWGIFLIALSVKNGWACVFSPLLLTLLLTKVSGIPLLEKKYKTRKDFLAYARRTNAFFPWFPR